MTILPTTSDPHTWGLRNSHDPTIVRDGNVYVMTGTDAFAGGPAPAGGHLRTSTDLIHWDWAGTALDGVPHDAKAWSGAQGFWACELLEWPGSTAGTGSQPAWHLYYSASTFGSNTSAIGLATAPSALGPWTDRGLIIKTKAGVNSQNAIDAAVFFEQDGTAWLTYGSFFSGLYVLELDRETGTPRTPGDLGTRIAARPRSVEGAIEGPYVVRRDESAGPSRFMLFTSFDSLIDAYDVRVADSYTPQGPYLDRDKSAMISATLDGSPLVTEPDSVGTLLLAGHSFPGQEPLIAPGHNSVFTDVDGSSFMVHHVRFGAAPAEHTAQIRRMFWLDSGWPVVSPCTFSGEPGDFSLELSDPDYAGAWQVVDFGWAPDQIPLPDDRLAPCVPARRLSCSGDLTELGVFEAATFTVLAPANYDGTGPLTPTLAFSGFGRRTVGDRQLSVAVFGFKTPDLSVSVNE